MGEEKFTILFDGFNNLPYTSIVLKLKSFGNFQHLLDYIFANIKTTVNALSYGNEWVLLNLRSGEILKKVANETIRVDSRKLDSVGIQNGDKLICKLF